MDFLRIFHIDCGRKYFSAKQLIHIIETLGRNGFNGIELAVGNGGMRLLLNDMEIKTSTATYSDEQVKAAINIGNRKFCDCGDNELSEDEIITLFRVAAANNIRIIPLLNSPGHMETIVTAMEELGIQGVRYKGSVSTLDFDCTEAAEFTKAFLAKYISFFSKMGCEYFNMGCDEYANDVLASGFAVLCKEDEFGYDRFISYVNELADVIIESGMKPIMFNDGMYYEENTKGGLLKPEIICSYWSVGWPGYSPAPARFVESKGHKIINTADKWYYVLGRREEQMPKVQFTDKAALRGIAENGELQVLGGSDNNPIGSMLCLWCDEPQVRFSDEETAICDNIIEAFADRNK